MNVLYDSTWEGVGGISRFGRELNRLNPNWHRSGSRFKASNPFAPVLQSMKQVRARDAQVAFSPGYLPPLFASIPTLITVHDLMYLPGGGSSSRLRTAYLNLLKRSYLQRNVAIATGTNKTALQIANWLGIDPVDVHVTGYGVSDIFFSEDRTDGTYALLVASERPNKNVGPQLVACSRLSEVDEIVWVTPSAPSAAMRSVIESVPMRVRTEVAIEDERLAELYRGAAVVSCFSLDEGFGLPAAEALASGCAVAHSARGGLEEVVGAAGEVGDPTSVESMATALELALGRADELSGVARAQASKFSWDAVSVAVNSILKDLAQFP